MAAHDTSSDVERQRVILDRWLRRIAEATPTPSLGSSGPDG